MYVCVSESVNVIVSTGRTDKWIISRLLSVRGNPADERVILFRHCEIHVAGVRNVEVRPAINTDTDPNPNPNPNRIPNRKLSLLEMAENNITRSSAGLPSTDPY